MSLVQISPYERVVLRSLEPARSQRTSTSPSPQYHDMIAGRPASVLSGGGDDATMYALGVLKWWRVAPRPAFFSSLLTIIDMHILLLSSEFPRAVRSRRRCSSTSFRPTTVKFPGLDRPLTQNPIFCQGQCQAGSTRGPLKSAGARLSEKRTRENRPRFGHFSLDFRQTDMDREVNGSFLMTGRFFSPFTAPTLDDGGWCPKMSAGGENGPCS